MYVSGMEPLEIEGNTNKLLRIRDYVSNALSGINMRFWRLLGYENVVQDDEKYFSGEKYNPTQGLIKEQSRGWRAEGDFASI